MQKEQNKKEILKKEDFLLPEEQDMNEDQIDHHLYEERKRKAKKQKLKKYLIGAAVMTFVSALLFAFGLFWQDDTSLLAIGDALWLAFAIEFLIAWVLFVYNHNIFSPLFHGIKTFGLMFVGKKPKDDYYTYMKKIEDDPIPTFYIVIVFISAGVLLIPALITLFILI
jgi:hypothetical protein